MATTKKINTEELLTNVAKSVGVKYGYENVKAEFSPFSDFKVKWTRSYRWADFQVSDYLVGADEGILADLFDVLFSRITGGEAKEYTQRFKEHILSPDFSKSHRPTYLGRKRADKKSEREFCGVPVFFSKRESTTPAYVSTLMKAIVIEPRLKDAPSEVLDAIIAHEYNILQDGLVNFGAESKPVFADKDVANDWLARNGFNTLRGFW